MAGAPHAARGRRRLAADLAAPDRRAHLARAHDRVKRRDGVDHFFHADRVRRLARHRVGESDRAVDISIGVSYKFPNGCGEISGGPKRVGIASHAGPAKPEGSCCHNICCLDL